MRQANPICVLSPDVARKIAAGEVIDRPCAIVRELMDNAIDSSASEINVEVKGGGIESVRVKDNGCGMTREDLELCALPHATSKLRLDTDLLSITTMGFRGEALSSIAAVSHLTIVSGNYRLEVFSNDKNAITDVAPIDGTAVLSEGLFSSFPARRHFLKRASAEAAMCRNVFIEKAISSPSIKFTLTIDGNRTVTMPVCKGRNMLRDRFTYAIGCANPSMFGEIKKEGGGGDWSFIAVIGDPAIYQQNRRGIYIYVNGRRVQEFSLVQAIEYGALGFFPNGTYPVIALFITIKPSLVDFNIHPAKKEVRFRDISVLHHAVSTAIREYYLDNTALEREREKDNVSYSKKEWMIDATENSIGQGWGENGAFSRYVKPPYSIQRPSLPNEGENTTDNFRFLGVVLGAFLAVEKEDVLYLIDFHAAHERLLYDEMMKGEDRQPLLVPYIIETENDGDERYMESMAISLTKAGFETRKAGGGKWEVWSAPALYRGGERELQEAVLCERVEANEVIRKIAAKSACRDALKDGAYIDNDSARHLAACALKLTDPHCPHGRPIYCAFTRDELFRLVRRT